MPWKCGSWVVDINSCRLFLVGNTKRDEMTESACELGCQKLILHEDWLAVKGYTPSLCTVHFTKLSECTKGLVAFKSWFQNTLYTSRSAFRTSVGIL
jgi:hypothetical protein